MSFTPTIQQVEIIEEVGNNDVYKIEAGAGAAKTSTLAMVAEAYVVPSLYLAFNKAMVVEAEGRFPAWVDKKTTHGVAYAVFGAGMRNKLNRPTGGYVNVCGTGSEVAKYFKIKNMFSDVGRKITANAIGQAIRETVNSFEYSADGEISGKHVSYSALSKLSKHDGFDRQGYVNTVLSNAQFLWKLRINLKSQILATHDTYLKLYQLSAPNLSQYEVIYLDEGQDTNDCVLDIFRRQQHHGVKLVIVGDRRQQIYSFRGSVNAMAKLPWPQGRLTTSFRFGQAIADLANIVLGNSGDECLKGWDQLNTEVFTPMDYVNIELPKETTRLYRTNAALLFDAVSLIAQGKKVNLEIDVKEFLRLIDSAVALKEGNIAKVKHESLLPYDSWEDLAEEKPGGEIGRVMAIVDGGQHFEVIGVLTRHKNTDNPDIILTTAHKSKGREWDNVVLADDFPSPYNNDGAWIGLNEMEENLLYVALTRAKKWLMMNATLMAIVERHKRKMEDKAESEGLVEVLLESSKQYEDGNHCSGDELKTRLGGVRIFTRPQGEQAGYLHDQMMDDYNGPDQLKGGM